LDDVGAPSLNCENSYVKVEIVSGAKEEVYWEKIPEKVRLNALDKMNDSAAKLEIPRKKRRQ
jgi:xRRM domain